MATLLGAPGDEAGMSVAGVGDLDGDGFHDLLIGATGRAGSRGAALLVYGPVAPGARLELSARADAVFQGELVDDLAGAYGGRAGDVDGDGHQDLLVTYRRRSQNFPGGLGLWFGGPDRFSGAYALAGAPFRWVGESYRGTGEQLGVSREIVGSSLLLGAMYHSRDDAHQAAGAAYLVPFDRIPRSGIVRGAGGLAAIAVNGASAGDQLGSAVAAPDLDGDGVADLVLGARAVGNDQGAVYLLSGASLPGGNLEATAAEVVWSGPRPGAVLGSYGGLNALVDLDGDGHDDLLAFAMHRTQQDHGVGYLVRGAPKLASGPIAGAASSEIRGTPPDLGIRFGAAGDFDGDGIVDLAVSGAGSVWVYSSPVAAGVLEKADAGWVIEGANREDSLAAGANDPAIGPVGDVDGDGAGEVVLGASGVGAGAGAAYLLFGDGT